MRAYHLLLVLLVMGGLAASYFMLPQPEERAAMYLRDGNSAAAIRVLLEAIDQKPERPRIVRQLAELYEQDGQIERAIAMMRRFVVERPDNAEGWKRLAELYDADGDRQALAAALARHVNLQPTEKTLRRLIGIYRLDGEFQAETRLIMKFAETRYVKLADIERAAGLLIASGRTDPAIDLLRSADMRAPPSHQSIRLLLFDAMLIKKHFGEAAAISIPWLKAWRQPWLIDHMVLRMARAAPTNQAAAFAIRATAGNREKRAQVAKALVNEGRRDVVKVMLTRLFAAANQPSSEEIEDYLVLARTAAAYNVVASSFAEALRGGMSDLGQARFMRVLFDEFGPHFLAPFEPLKRQEFMSRHPVLAADLALAQSGLLIARSYLLRTDLTTISASQRIRWLGLAKSVWPKQTVFRILDSHRRAAQLPRELLIAFASLSRQLGRYNEHQAAWRMMAHPKN